MEKSLQKLAKKIMSYDETALMSLWETYAKKVSRFEPSQRWEEAVVILNIIQAVRFKTLLLKQHWDASSVNKPGPTTNSAELLNGHENIVVNKDKKSSLSDNQHKKTNNILEFPIFSDDSEDNANLSSSPENSDD